MSKWDRIFTIIVTATLTSAAWIVAGATILRPPANPVALQPAPILRQEPATPAPLLSAPPARSRAGAPATVPSRAVAAVTPGSWTIPVENVRPEQLVNTFDQSRAGGARVHNAIDIPAPRGTRVLAAAGGTIERIFLSDDGGRTIYIRVPDRGLITYYAHLDVYAANLREGMAVRQGQFLGTVGYTGNASPDAPHLHFAIWRSAPGRSVHDAAETLNPYPLLRGD